MKIVALQFRFEDDELEDFVKENGDIDDWVFGEMCQNQGFGFLVGCSIHNEEED